MFPWRGKARRGLPRLRVAKIPGDRAMTRESPSKDESLNEGSVRPFFPAPWRVARGVP